MKILRKLKNYLFYCGIEKEEYNAVKKNAYVSNFEVWRILHIVMDLVFGFLFVYSLINGLFETNKYFYLGVFLYSLVATGLCFVLKKDSIISQFLIYLSIIVLLLFSCFVSSNKPTIPSTTFMVILIITPLFMIDKPYYMIFVIILSAIIFVIWMYYVKDPDVWKMDLANACIFTAIAIVVHVIANSIRIKEFVLIRKINIQKDIDEMTGLKNKGALSREINEYLNDSSKDKALMFILDINYFKSINDTYGHDVGDIAINQLGGYLASKFSKNEVVGRFGGDEFIIFIKDSDDIEFAKKVSLEMANEVKETIKLPDTSYEFSISVGVGVYHGKEKNYSELLKKADVALYKVKAKRELVFSISE